MWGVYCALSNCLNLFRFRVSAYFAHGSHKPTQGWKVSFWGSVRGKISVNIKMHDFVGNILQNKFYACCYILLSRTRPKRRCTLICTLTLICGAALGVTGAETSLLLIALNSSHPTLQIGITLQSIVEFYIIITSMNLILRLSSWLSIHQWNHLNLFFSSCLSTESRSMLPKLSLIMEFLGNVFTNFIFEKLLSHEARRVTANSNNQTQLFK